MNGLTSKLRSMQIGDVEYFDLQAKETIYHTITRLRNSDGMHFITTRKKVDRIMKDSDLPLLRVERLAEAKPNTKEFRHMVRTKLMDLKKGEVVTFELDKRGIVSCEMSMLKNRTGKIFTSTKIDVEDMVMVERKG